MAGRTLFLQALCMAAIMAHELSIGRMIGQRHRTVGTGGHLSALRAFYNGVIAPAVQQKDRLLLILQIGLDLQNQLLTEHRAILVRHVNNVHIRQMSAMIAFPKCYKMIFSLLRLIKAFHTGRSG